MARRKGAEFDEREGVCEYLIERFRESASRYRSAGPYREPWTRQADALEAGESIEIEAWQLPLWHSKRRGRGRVRVDSDGTVTVTR